MKILAALGIKVHAYAEEIGGIACEQVDLSVCPSNPFWMPDAQAAEQVRVLADQKISEQDSVGGVIACRVTGMPVGIGEPVFDKLDACLGKALFSIGAVKGVEIGDGFAAARSTGSQNNDPFLPADAPGEPLKKASNHAGGILGGMSDGSDILVRAAFKPTPSISREQQTVNRDGEAVSISIHGRHDPMIVPRAVVVVEAMTAVTLVDLLFANMSARMDNICRFYKK